MLVFLKFFCQINSVDAKSLVTSFNISGVALQLLGLNILDMNHDHTILQLLTSLRYIEVLLSQLGYFQFLGSESFTKCLLVEYCFLKVHLNFLM